MSTANYETHLYTLFPFPISGNI